MRNELSGGFGDVTVDGAHVDWGSQLVCFQESPDGLLGGFG